MSLNSYFRADASRPLEVASGILLGAFALLSGVLAVFVAVRAPARIGVVAVVLLLVLLALGLGRLGIRLLRGEERVHRPLLSPFGLIVGAVIFATGGMFSLYWALAQRNPALIVPAFIALPASYHAWRFALQRWRLVTSNKSLERGREG